MGPIGVPELIILFALLVMLAIPAGIVIALVWFLSSRKKKRLREEELVELERLRAGGLISDVEYGARRSRIVGS